MPSVTFSNIEEHACRRIIDLAHETIRHLHSRLAFKPLDKVTDKVTDKVSEKGTSVLSDAKGIRTPVRPARNCAIADGSGQAGSLSYFGRGCAALGFPAPCKPARGVGQLTDGGVCCAPEDGSNF